MRRNTQRFRTQTALESFGMRAGRSSPINNEKRVLLLGLGNDILRDDAIGLRVAAEARRRLVGHGGIEVAETTEMGVSLLDFIVGFRDLGLVDAMRTQRVPPGSVCVMDGGDLSVLSAVSPHFLGVGEVFALARELGLSVPDRVTIFAIEVEDPFTVSLQMTPGLEAALPNITEQVVSAVLKLAGRSSESD